VSAEFCFAEVEIQTVLLTLNPYAQIRISNHIKAYQSKESKSRGAHVVSQKEPFFTKLFQIHLSSIYQTTRAFQELVNETREFSDGFANGIFVKVLSTNTARLDSIPKKHSG